MARQRNSMSGGRSIQGRGGARRASRSVNDFDAASKIAAHLRDVKFPINSASELLQQLGGAKARVEVMGRRFDPSRMLKYLPAYYFPIASKDNMVEKIAEVIRQTRNRRARLQRQLNAIKASLSRQGVDLKFPIRSADDFLHVIRSDHRFAFRGRPIDPASAVRRIPSAYFPITSETDFDRKMFRLMSRPRTPQRTAS